MHVLVSRCICILEVEWRLVSNLLWEVEDVVRVTGDVSPEPGTLVHDGGIDCSTTHSSRVVEKINRHILGKIQYVCYGKKFFYKTNFVTLCRTA